MVLLTLPGAGKLRVTDLRIVPELLQVTLGVCKPLTVCKTNA